MKYTVSGSTLQYKVGLTLSFLSLISRGVYGNQKGNTSIACLYLTPNAPTLAARGFSIISIALALFWDFLPILELGAGKCASIQGCT